MMIPITRKEKYINEIVGGGDTAPKTPQTREEFFFAEILGEVIAPSPVTRVEKYLSAIAGQYSGELPEPVTRIERFLARAAGMDITVPVPITREEIFWSNYTAIVEFEVEGVPPLTYKAIEGTLENYRIYGDTVDGESVGDRTGNLFDGEFLQGYWAYANGMRDSTSVTWITTSKLPCKPNTDYSFKSSYIGRYFGFVWFDSNGEYISSSYVSDTSSNMYVKFSSLSPVDAAYLIINIKSQCNTSTGDSFTITPSDVTDLMLNLGSTALPYEPYGYKVPVTVEGKNLAKNNYAKSSTLFTVEEVNNFIHVSGTNNSGSTKAYVISKENVFPAGSYDIVNNSDTTIGYDYIDNNDALVYGTVSANSIKTFNFPAVVTRYLNIYKSVPNGESIDNHFQTMVVRHGTDASTYEPYHTPITTSIYLPEEIKKVGEEAEYIDYGEQKQHRVRKNLLQNTATGLTTYGVTITVNDDGSVTCNGTATSAIVFSIFEKELGQNIYILSGCPENGAQNERYKMQINPGDGWYADIGNGLEFEIQNTSTIKVRLVIYPSYTCDNLTFYPMIRKADIEEDTYEPYIENADVDVTLPALPTLSGTNTLSVETTVQPSKVYIKGQKERD